MRSIFTKLDVKLAKLKNKQDKPIDDYLSQVAKNIPAEVIAFYTGAIALMKDRIDLTSATSTNSGTTDSTALLAGWLAFGIGIAGTLFYSWWKNKKDDVPNVAIKVGLGVVAFLIWAYTIGQPFANYPQYYDPFWGGFALIIYLFVSPIAYLLITKAQLSLLKK